MGDAHPVHPEATAALVAMLFFFGVVCIGCLWAMLIRHCRRQARAVRPITHADLIAGLARRPARRPTRKARA